MKLKCETHDRRVLLLDDETAVHRSDGSHCGSVLKLGSFRGYACDALVELRGLDLTRTVHSPTA